MIFRGDTAALCREARGMSQVEAAKKLGMSQSRLSKLESGWADPTDAQVDAFADLYGQPRRLFFMRIPQAQPVMCVCCEPYAPPGGYR